MVLSQQSKAKWRLTVVANCTPKNLEEPSAAHSEVSQMLTKQECFPCNRRTDSPTPWGWKCRCIWRHERRRTKKGPGGGCSDWSSMLSMCVLSGYSWSTYYDGPSTLSRQTDPHQLPLSTCLIRPRCCTSGFACKTILFSWPAGVQTSNWLLYVTCIRHCSQVMSRTVRSILTVHMYT
jgi:hypothetical protein